MLNKKVLKSCRWLILERMLEFHQCFSRTNALLAISGKTRLDRRTVLHKNSQTPDAAKGNDFRLAVVLVKSRTSVKWQVYSTVLRVLRAHPWFLSRTKYSGSDSKHPVISNVNRRDRAYPNRSLEYYAPH